MPKLTDTTIVAHPVGGMPVRIWVGEELPEWAYGLVGEHLLDEPLPVAEEPAPAPERTPGTEPPRGGAGSSRDAWAAYATETGHGDLITTEMSKGDIIAALVDLGVIENR